MVKAGSPSARRLLTLNRQIHAALGEAMAARTSLGQDPGITRSGREPKLLDELCIDTIRTLSMDAVQQANSGHPGTPMALAPVAYTLWQDFLRYDPSDPA